MVGPPRGAAPMQRIDGARSGKSQSALPTAPRVLWRARIQGGIAHPAVVDERGSVVVSSPIAVVTELGANGKTAWAARTGSSPPAVAPVLTSDGTRVVLTDAGDLLGFDPNGRQRFAVPLRVPASAAAADPLPLADGGLVVAGGRHVLRLDRGGSTRTRARVDANAVALLARGSATLIVTDRGDVYEWRSGAEPSKLGSFGGGVSGAALHGSRLIAVVDGKRLVDLDLVTSTRHERVEIPRGLGGPPALGADGSTRVVTLDGLLLAHDRTGKETLRVALEPPTVLGDAGATGFASSASPPVIVDAKGNVGFVRPGLDAGVVDPAGSIHAATGAACLDPVGVTPAGPDRMLLACRSGVVFLLGR